MQGKRQRAQRWRWPRVLTLAVLLLGGVTYANVVLHGQSRQYEMTLSRMTELNTLLHEESSLQWKTLANRNSPVIVARELGITRAREQVIVASLGITAPGITELDAEIVGYHNVLDTELGLLGVGKTDEALTLELQQTDPLFTHLDKSLQLLERSAENAAERTNEIADLSLMIAMLAAVTVIGVLLFRFEREHRAMNRANQEMLAQQRIALDTLAENETLIKHQASHDPLTGLPNRRLLTECIEASHDGGSALLLIDLDDFKPVNDKLGHAAGDELLIGVAGRLLAAVRSGDTVVRLGGDEFAVVVDGDAAVAMQVAERIVAAVREPFAIADTQVRVGASVGVAVSEDGCDGTELLRRADMAMYDVKNSRKGACAMYAPALC